MEISKTFENIESEKLELSNFENKCPENKSKINLDQLGTDRLPQRHKSTMTSHVTASEQPPRPPLSDWPVGGAREVT